MRARLGAGSRCPFARFRLGGAERLLTKCPFTAARRCILAKSVAKLEGANGHALDLLREHHARRSGADSESRMRRSARERAVPTVSPGSSSPGHLYVTRSGPQRVKTTRYVLTRGPKTCTFGYEAILADRCGLGNPPREGRDPGANRGAFHPSDRLPRVGAK
jgi:hypothetical protein